MTPEFIRKAFGEEAFAHALFYKHRGALRFELSESGSSIEMFMAAYRKAEVICNELFAKERDIGVCLSFYSNGSFLSALSFFRELKETNISIPASYHAWSEVEMDDFDNSELQRTFILFEAPWGVLWSLLWGALAQDLEIRPRISGSLYLINFHDEIIVHPYDDRGMDVISPNRDVLKGLYSKFNGWLLDYDRAEMDRVYSVLNQ